MPAGAEAEAEGGKIRLKIWDRQMDEFVIIEPAVARRLLGQLLDALLEIARAERKG
jgi:hypothetical protein